jgi:hypothetical protein
MGELRGTVSPLRFQIQAGCHDSQVELLMGNRVRINTVGEVPSEKIQSLPVLGPKSLQNLPPYCFFTFFQFRKRLASLIRSRRLRKVRANLKAIIGVFAAMQNLSKEIYNPFCPPFLVGLG